jgi:hypothetical protein
MASKRKRGPARKTFIHLDRDGAYVTINAVLKIGALNKTLDDAGTVLGDVLSKMTTPPIVMGRSSKIN